MTHSGHLRKMQVTHGKKNEVIYDLVFNDEPMLCLNDYLGKEITLNFTGTINCINPECRVLVKKTYNQGYCFPCSQKLASCDMCILKPELCHYHHGSCREPEWGEQHCLQDHVVYLANSSGLKVGITRVKNIPSRFMDQGATQALPILKVSERLQSGLIEVAIKGLDFNDKTDWRKMLKGINGEVDLLAKREELLPQLEHILADSKKQFGGDSVEVLHDQAVLNFEYPVLEHPEKVSSKNFDKDPHVYGVLKGIKGQYLIFDTGVINLRKFAGYEVEFCD